MHILNRYSLLLSLGLALISDLSAQPTGRFQLDIQSVDTIPDALGLAGAFSGLPVPGQPTLFIGGGANFAQPVWETDKQYHSQGWIIRNLSALQSSDPSGNPVQTTLFDLPFPVAYGSSVSLPQGVLCMGGHNADSLTSAVFLVRLTSSQDQVNITFLPPLPEPATHGAATLLGKYVYYSCGQSGPGLETATKRFWRLDVSAIDPFLNGSLPAYPAQWETLPDFPGSSRAFHLMAAQFDGRNTKIFLFSGRRIKDAYNGLEPYEFLRDNWSFDDVTKSWQRRSDLPSCVMAGTVAAYGQSHLFVPGGADGSLIYLSDTLKDRHPGFPKTVWGYHTITDTWTKLGETIENQVTTNALVYGDKIIVPSGEVRPRLRTNKIWVYGIQKNGASFGWLNYLTLFTYLTAMLLVGFYFAKRNKNTNDYFRGGQRVPWWAAACSIFATMLSSLTYMSVPAKAYMTNWEYLLGYPAILLTSILVIYLILPFFRRLDATSAYEYLEKRFNTGARYLGSGFFILFQIGRMAIVMFLSALALAAITPFTPAECILIMGVLSIVYSTLGGIEAVIWTDTIQTFVLLGGAILIFIMVVMKLDGGLNELIQVASADDKFRMINWDWDLLSYTTAAFWVIVIGSFGQNLVSYGSDQAVVQRYMTTSDDKKAARSILTNGLMSLPAGLLFFAVGTALFVFYKAHPDRLDPAFQNDAIMPLFIVSEIPAGIAGLIIAGIFAAAQSTISTSMNSTSASAVTDFLRPWKVAKTERHYLRLARILTVVFGSMGILLALVFASAEIKSLLDQFFAVLGLFGGALGGLFLLGMFSRSANGKGAVTGAIMGAFLLFIISRFTQTHVYLYAAVGIIGTIVFGLTASLFFKADRNIEGLTVYDLKKHHSRNIKASRK